MLACGRYRMVGYSIPPVRVYANSRETAGNIPGRRPFLSPRAVFTIRGHWYNAPTVAGILHAGCNDTSLDYSWSHTNPKRKRGPRHHLPSLALRVGIGQCVAGTPGP